jgi:hypothetical protein
MSTNPLTLTRQTLYDLVWSKPMSTLAQDFGITDVGLAKRCRAVDVPIPYRGYWARVAAGQTPAKTPLPKYRTRTPSESPAPKKPPKPILRDGTEPAVNFGFSNEPTPISPPDPDMQSLQQRIEALKLTYATTIADTGPAVRRTAKHHKHRARAELRFTAGERAGLLIDLQVSAGVGVLSK